MQAHKPIEFKPWMWAMLIIAFLCAVFNFDPIGIVLQSIFGRGTDRFITSLVLAALVVYVFTRK